MIHPFGGDNKQVASQTRRWSRIIASETMKDLLYSGCDSTIFQIP